jgi:hypothetical protein
MFKNPRSLLAVALVWCTLLPASAFPLMYAPNDPRNGSLDGHPEPPVKSIAKVSSVKYPTQGTYFVVVHYSGRSLILSKVLLGSLRNSF